MDLLFLNIGTREIIIILLLILVIFVYTLYHVLTNKTLSTYQRSMWILIIVIGNLLGWLLYWTIGKNMKAKAL